MELDERGIPILKPGETAAPECPPNPCELCIKGNGESSWEWCNRMKTCGATIDWDAIFDSR